MSDDNDAPEGYTYKKVDSAFAEHIGKFYTRRSHDHEGTELFWAALKLDDRHVNIWGLGHAALMASLADIACSAPAYIEDAAPTVAIQLNTNFIAAPKKGEWLEACGWATRRTRSLVFTSCKGMVGDRVMFTATAINKIIGA